MRSRRIPAQLTRISSFAEAIDRSLDQRLAALDGGDIVGVGHGLAAGCGNLVHRLLSRTGVPALAVHAGAEIVDHDLGPLFSHEGDDPASDAAARAGHDCNFSVKFSHWCSSL